MNTIIFRALPLKRDSRVKRYQKLIEDDCTFNTWEDSYSNKRVGLEKLKIARKKFSKLFTYPLYILYLFLFSLIKVKKDNRIICMELDTFIPIYLGSFFKKNIIYLDIVDPIAQTKFRNFSFNKIFDYFEYYLLKYRKYNIIPNINRLDYYKDRLNVNINSCRYILVENVPSTEMSIVSKEDVHKTNYDIGYFGTLDESRGLLELIKYAKITNISLIIGGMGPLEEIIINICKNENQNNLNFIGSYFPEDLEDLYSRINFTWAYYTNDIFLHKYASPNKYYEHLAFKKPIIINEFIPLSVEIKNKNSGIVIMDKLDEINFKNLKEKLDKFIFDVNSFSNWELKYKNYRVDFIKYEGKL